MSSSISRRKMITTGVAAVAGVSGLAAASRIAGHYGLIPPDRRVQSERCFEGGAGEWVASEDRSV